MRIAIVRVDNIGDLMVTLPMIHAIKQAQTDAYIVLFARSYVKGVAEICVDIDDFCDIAEASVASISALSLDVVYFPQVEMPYTYTKLFVDAGVPKRVASFKKDPHKVLTRNIPRMLTGRYGHEALRNFILIKDIVPKAPTIAMLCEQQQSLIDVQQLTSPLAAFVPYVVLHTQSNKHGREWPLSHFYSLQQALVAMGYHVVFTGTQSEGEVVKQLEPRLLTQPNTINAFGNFSLLELCGIVFNAEAVVCAGTGPLHIAAAVGVKTIGLYPPYRGADVSRWQAIGDKVTCLQGSGGCHKPWYAIHLRQSSCNTIASSCLCMQQISATQVMQSLDLPTLVKIKV